MQKTRNTSVDILRGIAMSLVVLGHTLAGSTVNSESTFVFNVIWSLQMPLFFLISGFVTRYSKKIESLKDFLVFLKKRSVSYLLPWLVWTFLVRGLVFGQKYFFDLKYLFWQMDSGYWFLFSLFTISLIFGVSQLAASKLKGVRYYTVLFLVYLAGAAVLVGLAFAFGLSFLCIKLTLYYMPFYALGVIFGCVYDKILSLKCSKKLIGSATLVTIFVYFVIITRVNLYESSETFVDIAIRALASLTGCISLCSLCANVKCRVLEWIGTHSLDIYLIHYLLLSPVCLKAVPAATSVQGVVMVFANFVLTMLLSSLVAFLFNKNDVVKKVLLGK